MTAEATGKCGNFRLAASVQLLLGGSSSALPLLVLAVNTQDLPPTRPVRRERKGPRSPGLGGVSLYCSPLPLWASSNDLFGQA